MRKLKYLVLLFTFFPVMPDFCCMPVYAGDESTSPEAIDGYLGAILFFLCVLAGIRLWKIFIGSFEKGSF